MSKRTRGLIIGLVISVASLAYAFSRIHWVDLWAALRGASYVYLIPGVAVIYLVNWVRAYRWRNLMGAEKELSLKRVFNYVNIGYLYNNILPAKAGEVVRTILAGREIEGGVGRALSALLIERLLDVLAVVVLMVILIPLTPLPDWIRIGGLVFGSVAIVAAIVLFVLSRFGDKGVEWLWRLVGRIPLVGHERVKQLLLNILEGFRVLAHGAVLLRVLGTTAIVYLGYATLNYVVLLAFPNIEPNFLATSMVLCATAYSMVLPSSPGAIGPFEAAAIEALVVFGIGSSQAGAYALVLHLFTNLVLIIFGLVSLAVEGISYGQLKEQIDERPTS